ILAKALYADSLQAIRPELNADGVLDLVDARHPLLVEQGKVVGIDVQLGGDFRVLVVTGPNTGGKTVTLKTIGLLTAMAACVLAAATTHYPELKAFALNTPGVRNASMEFDANTLRPTFRLRLGLPGASNAFAIAERLGLDKKVLGRADTHLGELHRSLERTLLEAERQRTELTAAPEEARVSAADAAQATSG